MSVLFSHFVVISATELTAKEIINQRDDNEYFDTAQIEAEMIIVSGSRKITKTMVALTDKKNSLIEFTNSRTEEQNSSREKMTYGCSSLMPKKLLKYPDTC